MWAPLYSRYGLRGRSALFTSDTVMVAIPFRGEDDEPRSGNDAQLSGKCSSGSRLGATCEAGQHSRRLSPQFASSLAGPRVTVREYLNER